MILWPLLHKAIVPPRLTLWDCSPVTALMPIEQCLGVDTEATQGIARKVTDFAHSWLKARRRLLKVFGHEIVCTVGIREGALGLPDSLVNPTVLGPLQPVVSATVS